MSQENITLSFDEVESIIESNEPVAQGTWRWGKTHDYVIERDNGHYLFKARFHVEEGLQNDAPYQAWLVQPIEIKTIVWKRVDVVDLTKV